MYIVNQYDDICSLLHNFGFDNIEKNTKTIVKLSVFGTTFILSTLLSIWSPVFTKNIYAITSIQTVTIFLGIIITMIPYVNMVKFDVLTYDKYIQWIPTEINIVTGNKITLFEAFRKLIKGTFWTKRLFIHNKKTFFILNNKPFSEFTEDTKFMTVNRFKMSYVEYFIEQLEPYKEIQISQRNSEAEELEEISSSSQCPDLNVSGIFDKIESIESSIND